MVIRHIFIIIKVYTQAKSPIIIGVLIFKNTFVIERDLETKIRVNLCGSYINNNSKSGIFRMLPILDTHHMSEN